MRTQRRVYQRDWWGACQASASDTQLKGGVRSRAWRLDVQPQPSLLPSRDVLTQGEGGMLVNSGRPLALPGSSPYAPPREGRTGPKPRTRGSQSENWSGPWQDGAYSREHGLHQEIGVCILKRTLHLCMPWVSQKHGPCHSWWLKTERDSVPEVHCQPHRIRLEVSLTVSQGPLEFLLSFSPNPRPIKFTACWSYLQNTCRIQLFLTMLPLI